MVSRASLFHAGLLSLLLAPACGGKSASSTEGKASSCAEFCSQANECDSASDVDDCKESCTESDLLSRGGQEVLSSCLIESGCDESNPFRTLDCISDGIEELPPSDTLTAFCEHLEELSSCLGGDAALPAPGGTGGSSSGGSTSGTAAEPGSCLASGGLLSDELLTELNECFASTDCATIQTCVGFELVARIDLTTLANPESATGFQGALIGLLGGIVENLGSAFNFGPTFPGATPAPDSPDGTGGSDSGPNEPAPTSGGSSPTEPGPAGGSSPEQPAPSP